MKNLLPKILANDHKILLAIVFGSIATGQATIASDLDIAIQEAKPLTVQRKQLLIEKLAEETGRSIDLKVISNMLYSASKH